MSEIVTDLVLRLINLITNAIKFTRDRSRREIEVTLGASLQRPQEYFNSIAFAPVTTPIDALLDQEDWGHGTPIYVWVKCRDTGCGLSREEQGNLFTRFSQATPRTHIRYGGSGLGLFISKRLSELQGGAIGVSSQSDVGSTFMFFVATRVAAPLTPMKPDNSKELSLEKAPFKSAIPKAPSKLQYSVLIVEDNLVNQKVLSQQLRKAGCVVYVANHGQEALDFLRRTTFWARNDDHMNGDTEPPIGLHVVLMDIEMPGELHPITVGMEPSTADLDYSVMDGLTCTRRIRELQTSKDILGHIPIIAVSANARSEQMHEAREAGIDDAIAKPFRIPELIPKLDALVQGENSPLVVTMGTGLG